MELITRRLSSPVGVLALLFALLALVFPTIFVVVRAVSTDIGVITAGSVVDSIKTTSLLLVCVGLGAGIIGVSAAWLVTMWSFPLRSALSWGLVLPLAIPSYITAYVYAEAFSASGWLYTLDVLGKILPRLDVFSFFGLVWVMTISLYPYVYIAARTGFAYRGLDRVRAARSLGASELQLFWRILWPDARTFVFSGLALVLMETMADFGAADYLQVNTLTIEIFRAWHSYADVNRAASLSMWLLIFAGVFVLVERLARRKKEAGDISVVADKRPKLSLGKGLGASAYLGLVFLLGFILPVSMLLVALFEPVGVQVPIAKALGATLFLGLVGGGLAILFCVAIALGKNFPILQSAIRVIAMLNYAQAGLILALGAVVGVISLYGNISPSLSIIALFWVYVCRFANSGIEQVMSGLNAIPQNLHYSAQSLGADGWRKVWRVDLPLMLPSILSGGLIIGIEIMKELPATLILRPFGWDTLAVISHFYAKDEVLAVAALPALLICVFGALPIFLFIRQLK